MMKRLYVLLAGGVALSVMLVSCQAEREIPEVDITAVRCSIDQIEVEEDFATGTLDTLSATRATFSGSNFLWSAGDKIGIVPTKGAQIYFAVEDGAGTPTASFDGGDWAMKSTGTFYGYYPLYPDIFLSKDHVPVSYTGQTQSGNNNNLHAGDFWTLYTEGTTANGNTLNFSFHHLTSFFKTYVTVPAGTYTKIAFSAPSAVFIKEGYFDLGNQTPAIVGTYFTDELCLDLQDVTFTEETELTGFLVLAPVDITGIPITVTVYKDGAPAYEYTLTKTSSMIAAKTYAFRPTTLTQVVATVSQANALFASGETSVTITEPLTEDAAVVLPNTTEAVMLTLPTTASTSTLTVSYSQNADSYPATLSIIGPEGANLDIQAPNSTVTVNGISYNRITSRTAANTCIISEGVSVNVLKVFQGGVQVYGTVSQIDLSEQEDDAIIYATGTVTSLLGEDDEEYVPATGVSLNQSAINLEVGATETLIATVMPMGAYPDVVWTTSDETVATVSSSGVVTAVAAGSATITATSISAGFTAVCSVSVTEPLLDYVDLGLSVKWATRNLCETGFVSSPEEFGDYYAWGETEIKSDYRYWAQYRFRQSGFETDNVKLSKYITDSSYGTVDDKTTLDSEDDVAYTKLGNYWRMPTTYECAELESECVWEWTSLDGIGGYKVTGKKTGYTDKWIFLPAAGSKGSSFSGTFGHYWSSSLNTGYPLAAYHMHFTSSRIEMASSYRNLGAVVRPIYDDRIHPESVSLNKSSITLYVGDSEKLTATVSPLNATDKTVTWSVYNSSVASVDNEGNVTAIAEGSATIEAKTVDGAFTATCIVNVIPVPEAVDLGLSVRWAPYNVGANTPEDYGDYFAWGETEPKNNYSWATYMWCNGSSSTLTKYNTISSWGIVDNKTVLETEDEATYVSSGNWRMPTEAEWTELRENCTWTWTTQNGVNGYLVTASNGNSIFLPASGYYEDARIRKAGSYGEYSSASLDTDNPGYARIVFFNSSQIVSAVSSRYVGLPIRTVCP